STQWLQHCRFLQRAIDHQDPIHPCGHRLLRKPRVAMYLQRVQIAHQHDGGGGIATPELPDPAQYLAQAHAIGNGTLAGVLDDGAVRHRIGERHAQLDQVGTGVDQRMHECHRVLRRRIPRGDERDQAGARCGGQRGKALVDATHMATCSRAAMVCTSLSPRPDRLHRISASCGYSRASLMAWATAWLDSSAARMPSCRHSRWNAAKASSSVTPTYSARPTSFRNACSGPTPG